MKIQNHSRPNVHFNLLNYNGFIGEFIDQWSIRAVQKVLVILMHRSNEMSLQ